MSAPQPTLNERGSCTCGGRTFTMMEHVITSVSLAIEPGVLVQYGSVWDSEIINVECGRCGAVYDVNEIGKVKLKELAL